MTLRDQSRKAWQRRCEREQAAAQVRGVPSRWAGGGGLQAYQIIDGIEGPDDIGPDTGITLPDSVLYPSAPVTEVPSNNPQIYDPSTISVEGLGIGSLRGGGGYVWVAQRIEKDSIISEGIAADIPNFASVFTSGPIMLPITGSPGEFYPCYLAWQM